MLCIYFDSPLYLFRYFCNVPNVSMRIRKRLSLLQDHQMKSSVSSLPTAGYDVVDADVAVEGANGVPDSPDVGPAIGLGGSEPVGHAEHQHLGRGRERPENGRAAGQAGQSWIKAGVIDRPFFLESFRD
jgi:hypothetical protein